jgi:hypothetical protein
VTTFRKMTPNNPDAEFILSNAERLVKVSAVCVISFGLADGLNEAINARRDERSDWKQAAAGFQGDNLMMAALRTALLLDRDETKVSFQAVHRRLRDAGVRSVLLKVLTERHGEDLFSPSRPDLIDEFFETYSEINWPVYGRLKHFRNFGIAHLTPAKMSQSVTFGELRTLVQLLGRLAVTLQRLCQTETALNTDMMAEYRDIARNAMK